MKHVHMTCPFELAWGLSCVAGIRPRRAPDYEQLTLQDDGPARPHWAMTKALVLNVKEQGLFILQLSF
jgi:hypothetical protein